MLHEMPSSTDKRGITSPHHFWKGRLMLVFNLDDMKYDMTFEETLQKLNLATLRTLTLLEY